MPPGRPQRTRLIEVDAPTVDQCLKQLGLRLLQEDGWQGNDGMHRIQVERIDGGGVMFRVED